MEHGFVVMYTLRVRLHDNSVLRKGKVLYGVIEKFFCKDKNIVKIIYIYMDQ